MSPQHDASTRSTLATVPVTCPVGIGACRHFIYRGLPIVPYHHPWMQYQISRQSFQPLPVESELYASIKASSETIGQLAMMKGWRIQCTGSIWSDASAALGIIERSGLGKLRHIDVSYLWIQEVRATRALQHRKIKGAGNVADMGTKHI